jgi:hypothetical protein
VLNREVRERLEALAGGLEVGETSVAALLSGNRDAPNADIAIDDPELERIAKQLAKKRIPILFTDRRVVFFAVDRQGLLTGVLMHLRSDALKITRIKRGRRFVTGYVVLGIGTMELKFQVNQAENDELDVLANSQYADRP